MMSRLLVVLFALLSIVSFSLGDYIVSQEFSSDDCDFSAIQGVEVMQLGQCMSAPNGGSSKILMSGNTVVFYDCTDANCQSCTAEDDKPTIGTCMSDSSDESSSQFIYSATFPSQYTGPATVFYQTTGCQGTPVGVAIDMSGDSSDSPCTSTGSCSDLEDGSGSGKSYCNVPLSYYTPFNAKDQFVIEKEYSSSSCKSNPENATILALNTCWNLAGLISRYYSMEGSTLMDNICGDGVCGKCFSFPSVLSCTSHSDDDDDDKKRSELYLQKKSEFYARKRELSSSSDVTYTTNELVTGFPSTFADSYKISAYWNQDQCTGVVSALSLSKKESCRAACAFMKFSSLYIDLQSFCSSSDFLSAVGVKGGHSGDNGGSKGSRLPLIIGAIGGIILVIGGAVGGFIFFKRRQSHRDPSKSLNNASYRPLMQGDHHHEESY